MADLFTRWRAQRNRRKKERERKQGKKVENEVKQGVKKEDFLLNQIDEFREKAKQLQGLLSLKETML